MYNSTREFEACILVNGKPVTEVVHNGQTFIEGRKKSTYELYFRNNSSQQVLVVPSVDGLSAIDGQSAGKDSPGYVVDPWSDVTVPGWTVNGQEAAEFIFHAQNAYYDDEQTYAEEMGEDERNQGAIGFMVFRQKPAPIRKAFSSSRAKHPYRRNMFEYDVRGTGSPPNSILRGSSGNVHNASFDANSVLNVSNTIAGSVGSADNVATYTVNTSDNLGNSVTMDFMDVDEGKSLGTGFGEAVEFETQQVEFRREANPCAVFAFYYDTVKNLRRMGVPVEHFNRHYSESITNAPNPFPDSPEVTGYATAPRGWTGKGTRGRRRKTRS